MGGAEESKSQGEWRLASGGSRVRGSRVRNMGVAGNWASFVGRSYPWIFFGPVDPHPGSGWARLRAIHTTCLGTVDEKLKLKVRRQHPSHDHAIS